MWGKCYQEGHAMDFRSPANSKPSNLSASHKFSFYNLLWAVYLCFCALLIYVFYFTIREVLKVLNYCCCCWVTSVVSDSVWPHRRQPHQAPPSLGFSRQEHWSGLPFPSPMHEKWKVKVKLLSRVQLFTTHGLQPTRLLRPWAFPGKSTGVGCHCLLL